LQIAEAETFMKDIFVPRVASAGVSEVAAIVLEADPDGSRSIGRAICQYVAKMKPDALGVMKTSKSAMDRMFVGSVTKYCAVHSPAPVVIVPGGGSSSS